jgi:hypothetical protein
MKKLLLLLGLVAFGVVVIKALTSEQGSDGSRVASATQRARAATAGRVTDPRSGLAESVDDAISSAAMEVTGRVSAEPEAKDVPGGD